MSKRAKTHTFALEIGVEDVPAPFVRDGRQMLLSAIEQMFTDIGLNPASVEAYSTPRRLIAIARGVRAQQPDVEEEVVGPRYDVAFDREGKPTRAAVGFAKRCGVSIDELNIKEVKGGRYVACKVKIKGKSAETAIREKLPEALLTITYRKTMYWNRTKVMFPRPIRWLLCMLDDKVVDLTFAGVRACNITYGHRVLARNREIIITSANKLLSQLRSGKVIYDHDERKKVALASIGDVLNTKTERLELISELDRIVDTLENPTAVVGEFDGGYLELPREIIEAALMGYQNFFPVAKRRGGRLTNRFVALHDSNPKASSIIVKGYQRALEPRLRDARFFYNEDIKLGLDHFAGMLDKIIFIEKLGEDATMADKASRIINLAHYISERVGIKLKKKMIDDAGRLCKADLASNLIQEKEFSHLQGIAGMYYARASGYDDEVAVAIGEHYSPRTADDSPPQSPLGRLISAADKTDTVVSAFVCGMKPSGSEDPFAVRRQTLGLIYTLMCSNNRGVNGSALGVEPWNVNLSELLTRALTNFDGIGVDGGIIAEIKGFISERLRGVLKSRGIRYDIADAGIGEEIDDIVEAVRRAEALSEFSTVEAFPALTIAFKRVINMVRQGRDWGIEWGELDTTLLVEKDERVLYNEFKRREGAVSELIGERDYGGALLMLSELRPYVDGFFDNVLVMCDDERLKKNRLALMEVISGLFLRVADFTKVVVEDSGD